jgi:poly(hydroxyalkanoate) depolymerase family esterase
MDWNRKLKQLMGDATHLVRTGQLAQATQAIQQALRQPANAGLTPSAAPRAEADVAEPAVAPAATRFTFTPGARWPGAETAQVEDAVIVERPAVEPLEPDTPATPQAPTGAAAPTQAAGTFNRVAFRPDGGTRHPHHYHLFVPPGATAGTAMPLVLMLHGCTQNPEDFATGTAMNGAAAHANALVLYPEQPHSANAHGCWNWFRPEDQHRGRGEPGLLMAMVQDVMARYPVDATRVYVAGLSAGGAMAALLAREYPDVFAAAGVHSGLCAGAAHNMMAALSAMKNGAKPHGRTTPVAAPVQPAVPVIVFHGDADATVHARNGDQVVDAALGAIPGGAGAVDQTVERGASPAGQAYTRTVYRRAAEGPAAAGPGAVVVEHWLLHGAGHAWAGGCAQGSHTDPRGVDATREMLRFFLQHRRRPQV